MRGSKNSKCVSLHTYFLTIIKQFYYKKNSKRNDSNNLVMSWCDK